MWPAGRHRLACASICGRSTTVTETEVAIEALVSVRDKVIQAYEEIMKDAI